MGRAVAGPQQGTTERSTSRPNRKRSTGRLSFGGSRGGKRSPHRIGAVVDLGQFPLSQSPGRGWRELPVVAQEITGN
jgi:hypothetical protein